MTSKIFSVFFILLFNLSFIFAQDSSLFEEYASVIDIVVAKDTSGDFTSVQAAINAVPNNSASKTIIFIKKGVYKEKLEVSSSKTNLIMIGEDINETVLTYDDYSGRIVGGVEIGTSTSYSFKVSANDFMAMNLTVENSYGEGSQAVAILTEADRQVFLHCRFLGYQDTYYTKGYGRNYLKDCYIEGGTDYIFGRGITLLDSCQIHNVRSGGIYTAASTEAGYQFGYVFRNCRFTVGKGVSGVKFGRPWRPDARTVLMNCYEEAGIDRLGWREWDGREKTCFYAEYNCFGPGADTSGRISWSYQLTDLQAQEYTTENILGKQNNLSYLKVDWNPNVDSDSLYIKLKKHTTKFLDPQTIGTGILNLKYNGKVIDEIDPTNYEYVLELPDGTTVAPTIEVETVNPKSSASIVYPDEIPGIAKLTITSEDGERYETYSLFLSVNKAHVIATLDSIKLRTYMFRDIKPDIFEYTIILPPGTNTYLYGIYPYPTVKDAKVSHVNKLNLPESFSVTVTSFDKTVSNQYVFNVDINTAIQNINRANTYELFRTPDNQFVLNTNLQANENVSFKIYSLNGSMIATKYFYDVPAGNHRISIPVECKPGIYVYQIEIDRKYYSDKIYVD